MGAVALTAGLVLLARPRSPQLPPIPRDPSVAVPGRVEVREIPSPAGKSSKSPVGLARNRRAPQGQGDVVVGPPAPPAPPIVVENSQLKKTYSVEGLTLSSMAGSLTLVLSDVRFGGRPLPSGSLARGVAPVKSAADPDEVLFERGAVVEKYVARGQQVEQLIVLGQTLEALRGDGELTLSVSLDTALEATVLTKEDAANPEQPRQIVQFKRSDGGPVFTYGGAVAIDAARRRRALSYEVDQSHLQMTLDAAFVAEAKFPLTIDPLLGGN